MALDPRRHAFRDDLADIRLQGRVAAGRFVAPEPMQVSAAIADVHADRSGSGLTSQVLHGEPIAVFEIADGMAWVQGADGYVGYVAADALGPATDVPLIVTATMAQVYAAADIKSPVHNTLPFLARVPDHGIAGEFRNTGTGFLHHRHLTPIAGDMVSFAELFIGTPYLWGGRSYLGLDCSALIQLAAMACGVNAPRDSDMQCAELGRHLPEDEDLLRGDLIFWSGHVGMMVDGDTLLHSNGYHMATVAEPLNTAVARIGEHGPVVARKRL